MNSVFRVAKSISMINTIRQLSSSSSLSLWGFVPVGSKPPPSKDGNSQHMSGANIPNNIWRLGRLNHIAIAVPNLEASIALYRDVMNAKVSDPCDQPSHGVTTVFVELDNTKIELLYPLGENSPIGKFLEKNKSGGLHHVCLEVDNIEEAVACVKEAGIRCLSEKTKIGAHHKPVMFLHPADCNGVLLELEQA